jgi:hypothetical protein
MQVEVANGELIDKYTILQIKLKKLHEARGDSSKLDNVIKELETIKPKVNTIFEQCLASENLEGLYVDLLNINQTLWNIEDQIRECERDGIFGSDFIELARSVYFTNDERSAVKKKINEVTGSTLFEEKSYERYR